MKHEGCYAAGFNISWRDSQTIAAKKLLAPYPDIVPIEPLQHSGLCEHYSLGELSHVLDEEREAAKKWFQDTVSVYVLNIPSNWERYKMVSRHLWKLGITFKKWPGVDLTGPNGYQAAKSSEVVPWDFNVTRALDNWNNKFGVPGGLAGSMGRSAAHLSAMRNLSRAAHQAPPPAPKAPPPPWPAPGVKAPPEPPKPLVLILEDDVLLQADFHVKLRRLLLHDAPCDWVAISLHSVCPYGTCVSPHLTRVEPDGNAPADRCRHGVNYGFEGMLYRLSTLGDLEARLSKTVWDAERPHCLDIDVALASISDEVAYYAVPGMQTPGILTTRSTNPQSVRSSLNQADQGPMLQEQRNMDSALDMQEVERAFAYRKQLERLEGLSPGDDGEGYLHYERTTRTLTTTASTTTETATTQTSSTSTTTSVTSTTTTTTTATATASTTTSITATHTATLTTTATDTTTSTRTTTVAMTPATTAAIATSPATATPHTTTVAIAPTLAPETTTTPKATVTTTTPETPTLPATTTLTITPTIDTTTPMTTGLA